jgi:diketogulonate reductase-like aldo/keto reductase
LLITQKNWLVAWIYDTDYIFQKAINDSIEESDVLSREDFFIASKVWINYRSKELVRKSIYDTLNKLSLDYLDLYYIHWPMAIEEPTVQKPSLKDYSNLLFTDVHFMETYQELEKSLDLSNIGLCNFNMVTNSATSLIGS